eukprot:TRINITY_DN8661_c0_g2_i2.p1 TRINITY_DN8661_c0_g2~~TRINITY_DN8661_c0_g2_i2.p1  ORF type:complete len:181 (-),score=29.77 TRINITY_DN8661_c0_g2_i2:30-572(-)
MCIRDRFNDSRIETHNGFQILTTGVNNRRDVPQTGAREKTIELKYEQLKRVLAHQDREASKIQLAEFEGKYAMKEDDFRSLWSDRKHEADKRDYMESFKRMEQQRRATKRSVQRSRFEDRPTASFMLVQDDAENYGDDDTCPLPPRQLLQRNMQKRFGTRKFSRGTVNNIPRSFIRMAAD